MSWKASIAAIQEESRQEGAKGSASTRFTGDTIKKTQSQRTRPSVIEERVSFDHEEQDQRRQPPPRRRKANAPPAYELNEDDDNGEVEQSGRGIGELSSNAGKAKCRSHFSSPGPQPSYKTRPMQYTAHFKRPRSMETRSSTAISSRLMRRVLNKRLRASNNSTNTAARSYKTLYLSTILHSYKPHVRSHCWIRLYQRSESL